MNLLNSTIRTNHTQGFITKHSPVLMFLLSLFSLQAIAQNGSPCEAHRWTKGDHWTGVGCGVDGGSQGDVLGIVGCGNAANTESNIQPNATYDPNVFLIDPVNHLFDCFEPRRNHDPNDPVDLHEPFVGQKICWFNFDVRPNASTYFFQTISNDIVAWVLYSSENPTCSVNNAGLSGDCMTLHKEACGINFTGGWDDQPFVVPDVSMPTNLYLVVWKMDGTNSSNDDFHFEFKARFGCGIDIPITCPDDVTIDCSASIDPYNDPSFTGVPTLDNMCTGPLSYVDDPDVAPACVSYDITRIWTVTGDCEASCEQIITVQDNTDPNIDTQAQDESVACDGNGNMAELDAWLASNGGASASDNCSGVSWSNDFTSLSNDCGSTVTVHFTATDACGNASTTTATFNILDTTAPTIDTPAQDESVACDGSGNMAELDAWLAANGGASASDNCSSFSWTNDFTGLSGICSSSATVQFTATDACGNAATTTASFTIIDTTDPSIDTPAQDATKECDGSGNAAELAAWLASNAGASASDNCSGVSWSNDFAGLSDDCGATGTATVHFTATDACGNASTTTATFTIVDTTNPTIDTPAQDATVDCDGSGNMAELHTWLAANGGASASDDCSAVNWSNDFAGLGSNCDASTTVHFTATDDCGNASTTTATFTVEDTTSPVLINAPPDIDLLCGESNDPSITGTPKAGDNCTGNIIPTYQDVYTSGTTCGDDVGAAFDRIWTAVDECGNEVSYTQHITCGPCITVCALTQGFYGSTNGKFNGKTAVELIQDALGQLDMGDGTHRLRVLDDDAAECLNSLLPGGGAPKIFPTDLALDVNCVVPNSWKKNGRFASVLWGQGVTLWLNANIFPEFNNLELENACVAIPDIITNAGVTTIEGLLAYTSAVLSGNAAASKGQLGVLAGYLGDLHNYFDECAYACVYYDPNGRPSGKHNFSLNKDATENEIGEGDFKVMPNPLQDEFTINLDTKHVGQAVVIRITNQFGQVLLTETFRELPAEKIQLNAATLPGGIYQVTVMLNNQRPMTKTIVVVKP